MDVSIHLSQQLVEVLNRPLPVLITVVALVLAVIVLIMVLRNK